MTEVRRVSRSTPLGTLRLLGGQASQRVSPRKAAPADSAAITGAAYELATAQGAVDDAPEVREGQVDALRQQIARGEYRPEPREIAERILERGL